MLVLALLSACSMPSLPTMPSAPEPEVVEVELAPTGDQTGAVTFDYVLRAPGWSDAESGIVTSLGGEVVFADPITGIATVRGPADFAAQATATGAFEAVVDDSPRSWALDLMAPYDLEALGVTPDDEGFASLQWSLDAVNARGAWELGCDGSGVRVAIVDGGLYAAHPELSARVDVAASRSFVSGFAFDEDDGTFWHGTHVAGIVAASDDGAGVVGIAPGATLVGVKVLHAGTGTFGGVIAGILYAATPLDEGGGGADIINLSLGATLDASSASPVLLDALEDAVAEAQARGALVIAAAGNSGLDLDGGEWIVVPAQSGSTTAVSATAPLAGVDPLRSASYTNYGRALVTVAAPGGDFAAYPTTGWYYDMVVSTSRGGTANGGYAFAAGTSMAAPVAAGIAALALGRDPEMPYGTLSTLLHRTAIDAGDPGTDPFYGKGFVDAATACADAASKSPVIH